MKNLHWKVGDISIFQIVELEAGRLIQSIFKEAAPETIKKISWLFPHFAHENGNLEAQVQSFLIKSGDKNILVDTCNGNNKVRSDLPEWTNLKTDYIQRLRETGVTETSIDIVLSTHLHTDHVGWNTSLEHGVWIPTFPNAKYLLVRDEYNYWKQKPKKEFADDKLAFNDSVVPVVSGGLAEFVASNHKVDENIALISTPGHTPGHVSVLIESKGKRTLISGDFIHHPFQLAYPSWIMNADTFPDKAIATRQKMLNELADSNTLLIGSHFADPVAGHVARSGKRFVLKT